MISLQCMSKALSEHQKRKSKIKSCEVKLDDGTQTKLKHPAEICDYINVVYANMSKKWLWF